MSDLDVRRSFNALIDALRRCGDVEAARRTAELAVASGYWRRPDQRPIHFIPDLPAQPVHRAGAFYLARYFDAHAETIRKEILSGLGETGVGLTPVEEPLVGTGAWELAVFYEGGLRNSLTCERFPHTAGVIEAAPEEIRQAGMVMLSWLHSGTHILPHCGFSNARLRLHLPLRVADGAHMRIGDRIVTWEQGRSLVFDDSFEHEVRHDGHEPRLVLLVDLFHPALGAQDRRDFVALFGVDPMRKAAELLRGVGLNALALGSDGTMHVRFSEEQDRRIRRHMAESGVRAIRLGANDIVAVDREDAL
ncbi:aspartyl/asparaginyl beta-hydroxylase domain-containing protein [Sinorhizobium medicae]|nr:aspartyl/asparaginyl beta-hydroxylase domain-containing protein [Sinorhizobium medicae]